MAECGDGGFRLWPIFSAATFRRRILDALMCGAAAHRHKPHSAAESKPASPPRPRPDAGHSDRLSELLKTDLSETGSDESEAETRRKLQALEELQGAVRKLADVEGGENEGAAAAADRAQGAREVRLLAKDDTEARETLAMLGAIPPLVSALDSSDLDLQINSLYALLNLSIGNDMNKAAIVKAGAVHKMLVLLEKCSPPAISEAIVANFLGLSALDSNKPIIGTSGAIPFLVEKFHSSSLSQPRQDALRALFNLSISAANAPLLVDAGLVPALLASIGDMSITGKALAVLSNLVAASECRRIISAAGDGFHVLIDVLNWADSPDCQELAAYILMVMAHKSPGDRAAMTEAGIVSTLLELTLIGTALAQKRASRILECLRVDKGKQVSEGFDGAVSGVSAPLCGGRGVVDGEEVKAVKELVQQSLQNNMRRIVKRANLPGEFAPSEHFKSLAATATSKSLPF